MRAAIGGLVLGIGLFAALVFGFAEAQAQKQTGPLVSHQPNHGQQSRGAAQASSPDLLALSTDADGKQQITVIDPKQKVLAVYHVDRTTGAVSLRSVRNLQWDMLIEDFNSTNPTPREVRALTQQPR